PHLRHAVDLALVERIVEGEVGFLDARQLARERGCTIRGGRVVGGVPDFFGDPSGFSLLAHGYTPGYHRTLVARIPLLSLAMFFALAAGCKDLGDPDQLAQAFVDAYYLEYDFDRALALADGAAALRLKEEKSLADEARGKVAVAQSRSRTY